ncbi:hypothetical protein [Actinoplanes sp. NPDC049599]
MKVLVVAIVLAVTSVLAFGPLVHAGTHSIQRTFEWGAPMTVPGIVE